MSHSPPPAVAEGDPKAVSGSYIDRCRTKDCKNAPWRPYGYCLVCYNSHRKELGMGFNVPEDELRRIVEGAQTWGEVGARLNVKAVGPLAAMCKHKGIFLGGKPPAEKPPKTEKAKRPPKQPKVPPLSAMAQTPVTKTAPPPPPASEPQPGMLVPVEPAGVSLLPLLGEGDADSETALYLLVVVGRAQRERPTATGQRVLERLEDGVLSRFGGKA